MCGRFNQHYTWTKVHAFLGVFGAARNLQPRSGGFQSFATARRTIQGFEAMLWLRKGFGFAGAWTVCEQNRMLGFCFGLEEVNKA